MGWWGITARESDTGLDYLYIAIEKCLIPVDFKHFDVKSIMQTLETHIINRVRKEIEPDVNDKEEIQEYIESRLSDEYYIVPLLVADCLKEYYQKGKITLHYAGTDRKVTEIICTDSVLDELLEGLQEALDPKCYPNYSWANDKIRKKWIAHVKDMCDSLKSLKRVNGNG